MITKEVYKDLLKDRQFNRLIKTHVFNKCYCEITSHIFNVGGWFTYKFYNDLPDNYEDLIGNGICILEVESIYNDLEKLYRSVKKWKNQQEKK